MQCRTDIRNEDKDQLMISRETKTGLRMTGTMQVDYACKDGIYGACLCCSLEFIMHFFTIICAFSCSEVCGGTGAVFANKNTWSEVRVD